MTGRAPRGASGRAFGGAAAGGRICLVDDNAEFRESAGWWLEGLGFDVDAFDGPLACLEALGAEVAGEPRCLLFDVRMPEMTGLQLLDVLRERGVPWPVIFMTGHGDVPLAVEAMRRGALTFLEKPFQEAALEDALAQAFAVARAPPGEQAAPVGIVRAAPASAPAAADEDPAYAAHLDLLTPREREVMDLVVEGHPNKVVAFRLGISFKTVELHRGRVMAKMEARSLTHLVRMSLSRSAHADA